MSLELDLLNPQSIMPVSHGPLDVRSESLLDITSEKLLQPPTYLSFRKNSTAVSRGILLNKEKDSLFNKEKDSSRDRSNSELKPKSHIKFRDAVEGQELTDIKWVESYKEFNVLPDDPKDCACSLL